MDQIFILTGQKLIIADIRLIPTDPLTYGLAETCKVHATCPWQKDVTDKLIICQLRSLFLGGQYVFNKFVFQGVDM